MAGTVLVSFDVEILRSFQAVVTQGNTDAILVVSLKINRSWSSVIYPCGLGNNGIIFMQFAITFGQVNTHLSNEVSVYTTVRSCGSI